ncbi:RNA polymerase sigma factor [Putridiphycobacter roseus]|nr:sigma-70 family RNA polymerase sigma factor [Putridiphycobacter roseus]
MILDPKLLKRLKKLDKKAQLLFYRQCFNTLMSICVRYTNNKDDAAIFVNEAFLKIITNIDKIDIDKPLDPWMRKIAVNCIIDHFRKEKKEINIRLEDNAYEEIGVENEIEQLIEQEFIEDILSQLPPKTKLVLNLHYREGYSHKEIADKLNISLETSKWHVKSARRQLRKTKIAN